MACSFFIQYYISISAFKIVNFGAARAVAICETSVQIEDGATPIRALHPILRYSSVAEQCVTAAAREISRICSVVKYRSGALRRRSEAEHESRCRELINGKGIEKKGATRDEVSKPLVRHHCEKYIILIYI